MEQRVIFSKNLQEELTMAIAECHHDKIFVLTDETTAVCCWPVIQSYLCLKNARLITIPATDSHKDLDSLAQVWTALGKGVATRHSLLINLGGGMVTDLGGFAASTFKRGINFINIPTTLLAMVDASVGGKTGINYNGLKNEIGVFNESRFVILDTCFLRTLDTENLLSGYAEMLKHSLIANEKMWAEHLTFSMEKDMESDEFAILLRQSVELKVIREHYGSFPITCDDYDTLIELMTHDKKNTSGIINFTLLGGIGDIRINQSATKEEIKEALDFYRES